MKKIKYQGHQPCMTAPKGADGRGQPTCILINKMV